MIQFIDHQKVLRLSKLLITNRMCSFGNQFGKIYIGDSRFIILLIKPQRMKIADEQPSKTNLKQFLEDQSNRRLIVSTLMETLNSFGYKKSMQSLRKQTNVVYEKQHLETIQQAIKAYEFSRLPELIKQLRLAPSLQSQILHDIQELQLFYLFKLGQIDEVLKQIQTVKLSQEKMIKYCSMIALDSFESHEKDFLELQNSIIGKCKINQTQKYQAKSILLSYLTKNSINYNHNNNDIPKIIVAQSIRTNEINLKVTFIKLNQRLDEIIVIGQSKDQLQLSQWKIRNQTIKPVCSKWTGSIGLIQSIKWRQTKEGYNSYIGICSFEHLIIYKDGFEELVLALSAKNLDIGKFLCFDFDMNEEVIYVGGLFNKLMIFDFTGQLISQMKPFKMIREILVTQKRDLLAIQAVKKGGLFRYSLSVQRQIKLFQSNLPFMDLKLLNDKILVTNNAFVYIIDYDTFHIIATIESPQNKKCFQIQAFFCGSWIIVYNQKLKGILVNGSVIKQHRWQQNFDAVDVIGTKMITYSQSRIKVWEPSSAAKANISQHESSRNSVSSEQQNESSCFSDSSEPNIGSQPMESQEDHSEDNNEDNHQLMEIEPIDSDDADSQSS